MLLQCADTNGRVFQEVINPFSARVARTASGPKQPDVKGCLPANLVTTPATLIGSVAQPSPPPSAKAVSAATRTAAAVQSSVQSAFSSPESPRPSVPLTKSDASPAHAPQSGGPVKSASAVSSPADLVLPTSAAGRRLRAAAAAPRKAPVRNIVLCNPWREYQYPACVNCALAAVTVELPAEATTLV